MKQKKWFLFVLVVLPILAVIFNALPDAVRMTFAAGPEERIVQYYSGFSLIPPGYAVAGPLLSGIGAGVLALLGVIGLFMQRKGIFLAMKTVALVSLGLCLSAAVFGALTVIGVIIAVLLAAEALLLFLRK